MVIDFLTTLCVIFVPHLHIEKRKFFLFFLLLTAELHRVRSDSVVQYRTVFSLSTSVIDFFNLVNFSCLIYILKFFLWFSS